MLLTHEQARAAYKIMELASATRANGCSVRFGANVLVAQGGPLHVVRSGQVESHATLADFARAYGLEEAPAPVGRECCNENCGWVGPESECAHPKHDPAQRLCPKCHETTEAAA